MQGTQFSLLEILRRRWRIFIVASSITSLVIACGYSLQPIRYDVFGIYRPNKTEQRKLNEESSSDFWAQLQFLDQFLDKFFRRDSSLTPESKLIRDDEILQRAIQILKLKDHEGNPASTRSIRRRIRLSASDNESVRISIYDSDPEEAQRIINQLMTLYMERFAPASRTETVNFTTVLQPHLTNAAALEKQVKEALYEIQLGSTQTPLAPVVKVGDQTLTLQSFRINAQQQLSSIDAEILMLQQAINDAPNAGKTLLRSIIELSNVRKDVLQRLYDILNRAPDDSSLNTRLEALEAKRLELNQKLTLTEDLYSSFLEQQQGPWSLNQARQNSAKVLRRAEIPSQGSRPFLPWFLGLGALSSVAVGSLASAFVERRDTSLLSLVDLYAQLKLPIFGIVPHLSSKALSIQALAREEGTEFREFAKLMDPYAQILRCWELASLNRVPQVLAFTSAGTNEGKSLTVANLAYLLAKRGKKILLLEADLFRPSQAQYWSKSPALGLCDCIAGDVQLGKALQRLHPNLDLLQGGYAKGNKDILLNSPGFSLFMKDFRTRYDHILVDTPALSDSVHGYLIANCADATLLIARPKMLNQAQLFSVKETIDRTDQRLWGVIVNDSVQTTKSKRNQKLIHASQWDATIRLQKQVMGNSLEISTLSAINKLDATDDERAADHDNVSNVEPHLQARRDQQEAYLYQLPLDELRKLVKALWDSWSYDIETLLEQEEEVVQQSRRVRELKEQVEHGNPYLKLSSELQLKEEQEKLDLLAEAYVGQRPNLIGDRADLQFYLEILVARTDAESIPVA